MSDIKFGVCETCKHYWQEEFDPSPPRVALSPGRMVDAGCEKEDEVFLKTSDWDNHDKIGTDEDNQCPVWELGALWCSKHKRWYIYECDKCIEAMAEEYKEFGLDI